MNEEFRVVCQEIKSNNINKAPIKTVRTTLKETIKDRSRLTKNNVDRKVKNPDKFKDIELHYGSVFHITHIDNLRGILEYGLQSHNNKHKKADISNKDVNQRRDKRETIYYKNLHEYVPLYFNCRNAMLYQTQHTLNESIVILVFDQSIMLEDGTIFTNKNAATVDVRFTNDLGRLLPRGEGEFINWNDVYQTHWVCDRVVDNEIKQAMQAEVLISKPIKKDKITHILCQTDYTAQCIKKYLEDYIGDITVTKPSQIPVNPNDIFFSELIK